jgi:hypothetical protein
MTAHFCHYPQIQSAAHVLNKSNVLSTRLNLDLESVSTPPSLLLISKHPFGIEKGSANE